MSAFGRFWPALAAFGRPWPPTNMNTGKSRKSSQRGGFSISGGALSFLSRAADAIDRKAAAMTLVELGRIAARYETEMAHAMLVAVAYAYYDKDCQWATA